MNGRKKIRGTALQRANLKFYFSFYPCTYVLSVDNEDMNATKNEDNGNMGTNEIIEICLATEQELSWIRMGHRVSIEELAASADRKLTRIMYGASDLQLVVPRRKSTAN